MRASNLRDRRQGFGYVEEFHANRRASRFRICPASAEASHTRMKVNVRQSWPACCDCLGDGRSIPPPATDLTGNSGQGGSRSCRCGAPPRIKPDGHGRRRFRSTLDILVRDSSACHERRGKPRRTRMSIVRSLSSTAPTLRLMAPLTCLVPPRRLT